MLVHGALALVVLALGGLFAVRSLQRRAKDVAQGEKVEFVVSSAPGRLRIRPMSDVFTNAELAGIADEYFQEAAGTCPNDGTRLKIEELGYLGRRTVDFLVRCPRCGRTGEYGGTEPARDIEPWDADDRAVIVDEYWRTKVVRCPLDRTVLKIQEVREHGRGRVATPLDVRCRRCGRSFFSDEVTIGASPRGSFESRFDEVRLLAEGGMGRVTLVRERSTGLPYVAKEIKSRVADTDGLARFRREIRLLQAHVHPNLVRLVADFFSAPRARYVMEHLPGGHLGSLINDHGIPKIRLVDLFADAVAGVDHLHKYGIVHRDIKPKNILLGADGRARVSDLGLALSPDDSTLTGPGGQLGTRHYMAPEQRSSSRVTPRADVYPLALIAYEIVTRTSPYVMPVKQLEGAFGDLLARGLEVEPERRTVTTRELVEGLRIFVTGARPSQSSVASDVPTVAINNGAEFTQLGEVKKDGDLDAQLARLGYRRTGAQGQPQKGALYLGRGFGGVRGIYRKEKEPPPGGYSAADVFELLELLLT